MRAQSITMRLAQAALALSGMAACASDGDGGAHEFGTGHESLQRLELTLPTTETLLAAWSLDEGWRNGEGESISSLPPSVESDGAIEPLRATGAPASLAVRVVGRREIDIAPRAGVDATADNPCREFSARYFPLDDTTPVVAWPNLAHPDHASGASLFAERSGGELVQIFHCNRLDIYPQQAGREDLEFVLWHLNHADGVTDAIGVDVLE